MGSSSASRGLAVTLVAAEALAEGGAREVIRTCRGTPTSCAARCTSVKSTIRDLRSSRETVAGEHPSRAPSAASVHEQFSRPSRINAPGRRCATNSHTFELDQSGSAGIDPPTPHDRAFHSTSAGHPGRDRLHDVQTPCTLRQLITIRQQHAVC